MKKYSVAVITRTKNRNILLRRAIESVLGQSFADWIMVIVNDGGNAAEVEQLVAEYEAAFRGRCKVIHNPESLGMEAASNVGIENSDSDYVVIHDDDDAWEAEFLASAMGHLKNSKWPDVKGVVCYSLRVQEKIENGQAIETGRDDFNTWMKDISLIRLMSSNTFPPISFLYERSVYDEIGFYDEHLPVLGDWEFHVRFASHYEISLLKEKLALYYHRVDDKSPDYGNSVIAAQEKHAHYRTLVINRFLRKDIKNGSIGIGGLMSYAPFLDEANAHFYRSSEIHARLSALANRAPFRWFKRLFSRAY